MTYQLINDNDAEAYEPKPATWVDRWYNQSERSWVLQFKDEDGAQVGAAEYICGKAFALKLEAQMKADLS